MVSQSYSINQALSHKQTAILAPQLQQGVRVLQLTSIELQNEIDVALSDNLFLEKLEMDSGFEIVADFMPGKNESARPHQKPDLANIGLIHGYAAKPPGLKMPASGSTSGSRPESSYGSANDFLLETPNEPTLHVILRQQANATPLSNKQHHVLEVLIDSVNDKGYLRVTVDETMQLVMPEYVVTRLEVAKVIGILQDFEPVGVGARNSSECLLLQLREKSENTRGLELARKIVSKYLLLMARKEIGKIAHKLRCKEADVQCACALIRQLDPFPGMQHAPLREELIAPDLIVKKIRDRWVVRLNPNLTPAISIHHESEDLLKLAKGHDGYQKLKQTLQDAKSLLSNIEKRYQTILRVATLIIERQAGSLEQGEAELKPLTQKEIAELLEIHVSTVSRAVNGKYILTPAGVVELRSFFCSSISQSGGEDISSRAIRVQIKDLIEQEPGEKPLSDNRITLVLKQRGIYVARRTVMKYREQLGIPASPQRKLKGAVPLGPAS
jgi:RNA polymerase sigma-54 factor